MLPLLSFLAVSSLSGQAYPLDSPAFKLLVEESYRLKGTGSAKDFYRWLDDRLLAKEAARLSEWIKRNTPDRSLRGQQLADSEMKACAMTHRAIKRILPLFNISRGFEFWAAQRLGERQCLLQSVLAAGLLQSCGIDAGLSMVWKNEQGRESNLGHAVALVRLSNGRMVIVDPSTRTPFPQHRGLLVTARANGTPRFVEPVYRTNADPISSFRDLALDAAFSTGNYSTLEYSFVRSMFFYYRGERTVGGALSHKPTAMGLAQSERFLKESLARNTRNALAVMMLSRVYQLQGKKADSKRELARGQALYAQFGRKLGASSN